MRVNVETVFKKGESEELCREIMAGQQIREKCQRFLVFAVCASALYGFSMGLNHSFLQGLSSAIKVFLLFGLTLSISLPTLHFSGLLLGSPIKFTQTLCILLAGTSLTCIFLGAFAPIGLFFLFSGSSYEFLLLLHVVIFACCGATGLFSVKRNMDTVRALLKEPRPIIAQPEGGQPSPPPVPHHAGLAREHSTVLLRIWFLVYMFIGAQAAYMLSPFVGKDTQFILITSEKGDFFSYVIRTVRDLLQ